MTLAELRPGETARVLSCSREDVSLKLMEMGMLPGELVTVERIAPLGDPVAVWVSGYMLSLRKSEAATVEVERAPAAAMV